MPPKDLDCQFFLRVTFQSSNLVTTVENLLFQILLLHFTFQSRNYINTYCINEWDSDWKLGSFGSRFASTSSSVVNGLRLWPFGLFIRPQPQSKASKLLVASSYQRRKALQFTNGNSSRNISLMSSGIGRFSSNEWINSDEMNYYVLFM